MLPAFFLRRNSPCFGRSFAYQKENYYKKVLMCFFIFYINNYILNSNTVHNGNAKICIFVVTSLSIIVNYLHGSFTETSAQDLFFGCVCVDLSIKEK